MRGLSLHCKVLCMTTPESALPWQSPARDAADAAAPSPPPPRRVELARRVLTLALLLGVAADALLRQGIAGLGLPLWIALTAVAALGLSGRVLSRIPREAKAWLASAFVFAAFMAWRDSDTLRFFDALAVIGSIGLAAVALRDERAALFAERLRDTIAAFVLVVRGTIIGIFPLALRDAVDTGSKPLSGRRLATAARVVIISGVLLIVFGALLRSADPIFASLVRLPHIDAGVVASHVVVIAFFTAVCAGWARAALMSGGGPVPAPTVISIRLGRADVTAALGTLLVLFTVFVAAQLGWLFGGEHFLRERTGLTAAEYARRGFFQMMWVVGLVVPVLAATRVALDPSAGDALRKRHERLALPIIALLVLMIVSAFLRMRLYVKMYGLTTDRLYPVVAMVWLAFVLVWLERTLLRDRGRRFAAGVVISGLFTLAALDVAAPDVIVAKVNLARAARPEPAAARPLDIRYLASLGGEAIPLATHAVLAAPPQADDSLRCDASRRLLRRWGPSSRAAQHLAEPGAWRIWNAGAAAATRAVGDNARALRLVEHDACPRARPLARQSGGK